MSPVSCSLCVRLTRGAGPDTGGIRVPDDCEIDEYHWISPTRLIYTIADVAKLRAQSPVNHAQHIKVPVMLIHGRSDWRADYEHAERMKAALEKNQKKVEWLALGREGHGVYDENTRREVYGRILQFLDANLRTPQSTASQQD